MEQLLLDAKEYISDENIKILKIFLTNVYLRQNNNFVLYFKIDESPLINKIIEFLGESNVCNNINDIESKKLIIFKDYECECFNENDFVKNIKELLSDDSRYIRKIFSNGKHFKLNCGILFLGTSECPEELKSRTIIINFY